MGHIQEMTSSLSLVFVMWTVVFDSPTTAMSKKTGLQRMPLYFGKRVENYIDFFQDLNQKSNSNDKLFESKDNENTAFSNISNRRGLTGIKDFDSKYTMPSQINTPGIVQPLKPPTKGGLLNGRTDPTIKYSDNEKPTKWRQIMTKDDYNAAVPRTLSDYNMNFPNLGNDKESNIRTLSLLLTMSKIFTPNEVQTFPGRGHEPQDASDEKTDENFFTRLGSNQERSSKVDANLKTILPTVSRIRSNIRRFYHQSSHMQPQLSLSRQSADYYSGERWRKRRVKSSLFRMPQYYGKRTPGVRDGQ